MTLEKEDYFRCVGFVGKWAFITLIWAFFFLDHLCCVDFVGLDWWNAQFSVS